LQGIKRGSGHRIAEQQKTSAAISIFKPETGACLKWLQRNAVSHSLALLAQKMGLASLALRPLLALLCNIFGAQRICKGKIVAAQLIGQAVKAIGPVHNIGRPQHPTTSCHFSGFQGEKRPSCWALQWPTCSGHRSW
jgi:hypothetical protein